VGRDTSPDSGGFRRLALVLEYNGQPLCGWQRQINGPSVQSYLEEALGRIEGRPVQCVAAGRTDSGVHAEAQLAHVDIDARRASRSMRAYTHGLNMWLPEYIRVVAARAVGGDFHARFDCQERAYRYQIWNRGIAPAIHVWRHWWMPRPLDIEAMQLAANALLGRQDFSSFRASGCQSSSSMREVRELHIERKEWCIMIDVRANGFLYHMVRNIVGTLVEVGVGKRSPAAMGELIHARDRRLAGDTAPAYGLYFTDAVYPDFSSSELVNA